MAWLISSARYLPGVNFETPVTLNDLGFQFDDVFADEQRNRLQLVMGGYLTGGPHYGIVDESNPRDVTVGSTRAFVVSVGANTTVDVQPGVAVTKSGNIIIINNTTTGLVLANPVLQNIPYVVYLEYLTVDDTETNTLTRYNTVEARRRISAPDQDILKVATLADYQNPAIFTPSRLNEIVVLAVVTNSTAAGSLIVDLSNNTSSFNRPWFSPVDNEHRALRGTGSSLVPHSLGLNDLSQGNLTLYQQMLRHGIIISKDYDVPGCPGKLNVEVLTSVRELVDADGTATGTMGQRYFNLLGYPLRVLAARSRDDFDNAIAVSVIPNTNILVLPTTTVAVGFEQSGEVLPVNGFEVYYTSSSAVEPPTTVLSTDQMQFGTPDEVRELYVTGGKAYNDLPTNTLSLGNAGPFPRNYTVFLDGNKQFLMAPQVVACVKYIDSSAPNGIGNAVQTPEFSMAGNARISVGLNDLNPVPPVIQAGFSVTVQIIGKDINGVSVTESVTFTQADYEPVAIPVSDCGFGSDITVAPAYVTNPPKLYKLTSNIFSSVTSWVVSNYANMSPQTVVMLWADLKSPTTVVINNALSGIGDAQAFNSLLPVADIRWSGENVCRIRDLRPVESSIQRSEFMDMMLSDVNASVGTLAITGVSGSSKIEMVAAEDFNNPRWMDNIRTQRSRFSDGLRSYFWPGPVGTSAQLVAASIDPTLYAEYYYTRAIYLPVVSGQQNMYVKLFNDKPYPSAQQAKNVVQYRLASTTSQSTWGAWLDPLPSATGSLKVIPLVAAQPWLKVQFRFVLHDVRGFTAIMTGV